MRHLLLVMLLALLSAPGAAQTPPWTGILDPSRAIDWSHAGVQMRSSNQALCEWNGQYSDCVTAIPNNRTQCGATLMPSGSTGITDAQAINTRLQSCPANTYLLLGPGTFYIVFGLTFGSSANPNTFTTPVSNVTLRGSGPDQTTLRIMTGGTQSECSSFANAMCIAYDRQNAHPTPSNQIGQYTGSCQWMAGYTHGSTQLTVTNCYQGVMPTVGQLIVLDQRNDDIGLAGCTSSGTVATCTVSTAALPSGFVVGACVAVGGVQGGGVGTQLVPNSATGYNTYATTPQRNPAACGQPGSNPITAVSGNTFSYTLVNGGPNLAATTPCIPTSAPTLNVANQLCGQASVDNGAYMVTGVLSSTISERLFTGRGCPDSNNVSCESANEISWRTQNEVTKVTAVTPSGCTTTCTLTIDTPLHATNWRASQHPGIWWMSSAQHEGIGIESMTIDSTNDGGTQAGASITILQCYNCWVRNIRSIAGSRAHVWAQNGVSHLTVRDSYFYGTKRASNQSYGVELFEQVGDCLVENNIFIHVVAGSMASGSVGSVFSYNYYRDDGYNNVALMMSQLNANHDVSGYQLFESNNGPSTNYDNVHGSSISSTNFRERARGQNRPRKALSGLVPVIDNAFNRGINYIGSVLGTYGIQSPGINSNYQCPTSAGTISSYCSWTIGPTAGSATKVPDDPFVAQTMMRWGNYDVYTGAARWCGTGSETNCGGVSELPAAFPPYWNANPVPASHTLPPSFYLTAKPAWYATSWGTPPWPSIGPDVTGGTAPDGTCGYVPAAVVTCSDNGSGMAYSLPSQLVSDNMPVDTNYLSNPNTVQDPMSWSSNGANPNPGVTVNGSFALTLFETFQVTGATPAAYNGEYQVALSNGPTTDASASGSAGTSGSIAAGTYRFVTTRVNNTGETPGSGYGAVSCSANCNITVTSPCAAYNALNCPQIGVGFPNPPASTGYNVYMLNMSDPAGQFCRQNATPVAYTSPTTTPYSRTTPICTAAGGANCSNTGNACIQPPLHNTALATQISYFLRDNPGSNGTGGTISGPQIGVFNADNYYGVGALPPPPTASMSVTPTSITAGQSATLSWSTSGANTVSINNGIGTVAASGSQSVSPSVTTTYTLTATNANGTTNATATLTVGTTPPPTTVPGTIQGVGVVQGQGVIKQP